MTKQQILEKLDEYKQNIEAKGHIVYTIALKGSQNYNLDDKDSDIDANAVLIPTLAELRNNRAYKYTFDTGEVTCHNIYSFADIAAKGNPQFIEVCNSQYAIGDLSIFKDFKINPSALKGMFMEKLHAFDKVYPSTQADIEKYGYAPKQVHHLVRLYDLLVSNQNILTYSDDQKSYLMDLKRGRVTKDEAIQIMNKYKDLLDTVYPEHKAQFSGNTVDYSILDKIVMGYLCRKYS